MATTTLDRYRHIATLGSGGMATVVLAEDTVLGREVALKQIKTGGDARSLSRLRREALIGASVSHPNLVSIYDVVTLEDGDQVIVMEYVAGETLRDALFRETRLDPVTALRMLEGVSAGLDAIHREGIVHRDVKPANILLGSGDTVKLADLGVASTPDRTRITTDGALVGTFSYMAPEQLSGSTVTKATDVYALSAVAFEALCGRKAHPESNPVALAHAVATQPAPDLRDVWPGAPAAAAEVLIRGMSKEPGDRPRSASELTGRLRAALDPYTTAPQAPVSAPARRPPAAVPVPPQPASGPAVPAAASVAAAAAAEEAKSAPPQSEPEPASTVAPARARPVKAGPRPAKAGTSAAGAGARAKRAGAHEPGEGRRAGLIAGALILLVALAVALPILLTSGGKSGTGASTAAHHGASSTARAHRSSSASTAARTTSTSQGAAATPSSSNGAAAGSATAGAAAGGSATGSAATAGSPTAAVESFYGYAASHRYSQAWALADPAFRNQLGGYSAFSAQQSGDRRITFNSANVTSQSPTTATVAIQTTSVRNTGTQQCSGTVDLARTSSSATWLLHLIHINCQ